MISIPAERLFMVDARCSGVANKRRIADGQDAVANVSYLEIVCFNVSDAAPASTGSYWSSLLKNQVEPLCLRRFVDPVSGLRRSGPAGF